MAITGLHTVVFSAPDMTKGRSFFADWGMRKVGDGRAGVIFETLTGSRIVLRPPSSKLLPPPARRGMNSAK